MRLVLAWVMAMACLLPLSSLAQDSSGSEVVDAETVHSAFVRLVDRGEMRAQLFGLPADAFWRRSGGLRIALLAEDAASLTSSLERVMAIFSEATGQPVSLIETGASPAPEQDAAGMAPEADLVIAIGSRPDLAQIAFAEKFDLGMLARFELGTLPFMFSFAELPGRRSIVLLADDEPPLAREASFILATVWALGGVTLGPELTGLVGNDEALGPSLTPLGQAVFRLFFNDALTVGMSIEEVNLRAKSLLAE